MSDQKDFPPEKKRPLPLKKFPQPPKPVLSDGVGAEKRDPLPLWRVHATLTKSPPKTLKICHPLPKVEKSIKAVNLPSEPLQQGLEGGADSRIRTDDQRFTKPLLYH